MPNRTSLPALLALAGLISLAGSAQAQDDQSRATDKTTVPADVRARVVSKLQGSSVGDVSPTPVPGLYEVTMGAVIAYVTADGKYLVTGNVYDLKSLEDFNGVYGAAVAGIAVQEGKGATALINTKKVQLVLTSKTKGATIKIAAEGLKVTLEK